jgi:hypothetical protein
VYLLLHLLAIATNDDDRTFRIDAALYRAKGSYYSSSLSQQLGWQLRAGHVHNGQQLQRHHQERRRVVTTAAFSTRDRVMRMAK